MSEIYQLLDQLEPIEQDQQQMRPLTTLFYYPLGLALFTVFMYLVILYLNQFSVGTRQHTVKEQ